MQITIKAEPKSVEQGRFNYSNTYSSYGVNTQYFTKTASRLQLFQVKYTFQDCRGNAGEKPYSKCVHAE